MALLDSTQVDDQPNAFSFCRRFGRKKSLYRIRHITTFKIHLGLWESSREGTNSIWGADLKINRRQDSIVLSRTV